jgi:ribosomal protein S18 acetylase RimI-like enzyme
MAEPRATGTDALTVTDRAGRTVRIRPVERTDRAALETMYLGFEPKRGAQGLPPADAPGIRRWLDRVLPRGLHRIALVDGRIVGHVMLVPMDEPDTLELASFVHQSARNRGIGTALNAEAVRLARRHGARRVWLSVEPDNRAAIRSYERVGFRRLPGSLWAPEMEMAIELAAPDGGAAPAPA